MKDLLNIMIVDDEEFQIDLLKQHFKINFKQVRVVATASNIHDAYHKIIDFKPQLVFLDIGMPNGNGFELIKTLRENRINTKIVIFSGKPEYAYKAIKMSVFDFIQKPWELSTLRDTILKFEIDELQIDYEEQRRILLQQVYNKMLLKADSFDYFIKPDNIIYCLKKDKYKTILYLKGQTESVEVNISFKDIETRLPRALFFKINRTHLINLKYIYKITGSTNDCILRSGNILHNLVGERRKIKDLRELLYKVY